VTTKGHPRQVSHPEVAHTARQTPGVWVQASVYTSSDSAGGVTRAIRSGVLKAYAPAGKYQAAHTRSDDGSPVWVRFVDGEGTAPAVPATMAVRVRHDGDGPGYEGVGILTVTVDIACPACGAPRGFDTIRPHVFRHDGDTFEVDVWDNPCGHVDLYADVVAESRHRDSLRNHPELPEPVRLILAACGERTIRSGKQAADLLASRGFTDEAALIRAEVKQCNGLMSAKQAAGYLRNLTAAVKHQTVSTTEKGATS
jgi:hypothetical protein